ncbi:MULTISPECIES: thioesterase family protein [unclassified Neisseria]|uniref:acyl-CoA thioesterase n=1 Tax=unclassified Neisseria TaxID=2623750 RepID=UPI002665100B|nr:MULTISPECIES: acyl-CoA thioesterase [unclassified Neisseria]MDO1509341.1 acyl-CoA thioesterase [Neisseria sp. MVDL19-042950]MDO1515380.1 acyl-CoA thioesterase [Neisseria sp. MVDL18-041461]MDO1562740.1 acyl-CoA thioesterase [Neisseria sp. MVDL20-010259]
MAKHVYCRHSIEIEVPFFDVDAMHIVWHGHYVKYLEVARCAFLSEIGYDYTEMGRQGFSWPVVQMNLKYVKPARFGQKIRVDLEVVEIESCLRIDYTIVDAESGMKLTKAGTTQAAVSLESGEMQFQTPESWLKAVREHHSFQAV